MRRGMFVLIVLVLLPLRLHAWSYKEHIQFARIAATRLIDDPSTPPAMKDWLKQAVPKRFDMAGEEDYFRHTRIGLEPRGYEAGILHWAYMPDVHAFKDPPDSKVQPLGLHEKQMHFIDLELFLTGDVKREYRDDLSGKPSLASIPRDIHDSRYAQAGVLPLRIEYCSDQLVKSIRDKRLLPTSRDDHDNAVYWAGYLAHYAADNTQPHHATIDYKSASYFKNPRKAPNVHAAVEYMMCDDEKNDYPALRGEFWPLFVRQLDEFSDPVTTDDPFQATLEVAMTSYDALPLIGNAATSATRPGKPGVKTDVIDIAEFFHFRGTVAGKQQSVMEMKARQTAWAVKRIERLWLQAWKDAQHH
ncbi:MAG: hypothetical protein ACREJC_09480 [Tepidisphaeraceae bacterium]